MPITSAIVVAGPNPAGSIVTPGILRARPLNTSATMIESNPRSPAMVWVVRRFFSGNPLTRAISERTIAVVSAAGFACGASSAGALSFELAGRLPCPYAASTAACSRNSAMRLSIVESFVVSVVVTAVGAAPNVAGRAAPAVCSLIQNRLEVLNE